MTDRAEYSPAITELAADHNLFGRMNDPTAAAHVRGPCGDEMEFYLVIANETITDVRYHTDGCDITRACGAAVARMAHGLTVEAALGINPKGVADILGALPSGHRHCPILAVTTFYRAIADYLLKP